MLRKRYGEHITEELNKQLVNAAYQHVSSEWETKIYGVVELPLPDIQKDSPVNIEITVDIQPDFELPEYKGLEIEVPSDEVTDEEIDQAIENIRRQRSEFNKVDRPARKSDYVQVTYIGKIGDELIADILDDSPGNTIWGTQEKTWEEVAAEGDMRVGVPVIIDGLVDMSAGDKKEVEMTFPDDHPVEQLRGKTATYSMELHEVRERILPEINEEFLKSMQSESLEDFKARVLDELEGRKKQDAYMQKRQKLSDILVGSIEIPLPESAIERETQQVMGRIMQDNMQRGVTESTFEEHKEELYNNSRSYALRNVKLEMILNRIAEEEKIEVVDKDFEQVIMQEAMQTQRRPEEIVKELRSNPGRLNQIRQSLLRDKALAFVVDQAKVGVTDNAVTPA